MSIRFDNAVQAPVQSGVGTSLGRLAGDVVTGVSNVTT
jgi:hypothetical protein